MIVLIFVDTAVHHLFRDTLLDVHHFTERYLIPMIVFFALSTTQRIEGYVAVSLLENVLPARLREIILSVVDVLAAACFALIA